MNVPRPALIAGIIGTLAFGAVGGAVFDWLTVPLAWLIGAMVITTAAALTGAPLKGPGQLRNVMIGVLGIMLGSAFTSDALDNLGQWLSSLSVLLAFIVAVTTVVALYLVRIGGYDPISAFFSASPGGLATMVVMGGEMGGDERSIALTHSIRVMLTVLVIPFWFRFFHGYEPGGLATIFGNIGDIAGRDLMILLLCGLGYPLARLLRLPAALSVAVHLSGVTEAKPPAEIVNLAQVVIGTSIGCRFVNIPVMRVLKVLLVSAGATCFMLALAVAAALGVEAATGLPFPALWLAFAPGGLAEMTLISLAMGIDTAFVSTHHLLRVVFMVTAAPLVFALIRKRLS